jgi:hypothetical protein
MTVRPEKCGLYEIFTLFEVKKRKKEPFELL